MTKFNFNKSFKRILDIMLALILLVIFLPLIIIVSIAIKIDTRGPVIFKQLRIGENGKIFKIYKFRTMIKNAEFIGSGLFNVRDDFRVTRVGKILRKTSIDEIPQLINILRGEMSFVGPRPPVIYELGDYKNFDERLKKRFTVKPGITGYAQVYGRNSLSWEEKIFFDLKYIDDFKKYGILIDFKVLFLTVIAVLSMKNIYELPENIEKDKKLIDENLKKIYM